MKFHSVVQLNGKTATGIPVPAEVVAALGPSKRPAVKVTLNDYTYRTSIATVDGEYMLSVSAEVREKAGVKAGDQVDVDVELDTAPREVALPPDFAAALDRDPNARRAFDALSYSNKQRLTLPIQDAKTPETRQRRIEKAIASLKA